MLLNSQPEKVNGKWSTHSFYGTVSHLHLSFLLNGSDLIDLMLVECGDGRWFIEQVSITFESEQLFDAYSNEFVEPKFYSNSDEAEKFACKLIAENTSFEFEEIYPYFED
jgi:hypothetical protein